MPLRKAISQVKNIIEGFTLFTISLGKTWPLLDFCSRNKFIPSIKFIFQIMEPKHAQGTQEASNTSRRMHRFTLRCLFTLCCVSLPCNLNHDRAFSFHKAVEIT